MYGSEVNTSRALTTLNQQSESDLYWFVAMDTTTGCSDTASAYINVLERPKISMISADMPVCEGNMIQLDPYLRCIDDMGTPIIDQYWMLDGERFDPTDSVAGAISYEANGKVISYYAENRCGSSSSLNSHNLLSCYGDSLTTQDSLIYLDNDTIAFELLRLNQLVSKDSILLNVHKRYNPDSIIIETDPHDPARIWNGESITLTLKTDYDYHYLVWRKVKGKYDMENYNSFVGEGFIFNDPDDEQDEVYETSGFMETPYIVDYPTDTAYYYVSISDGVCPETPSRLTEVDVLQQIPTAFTPHTKDGLNDVFMKNHHVTIFDRYGEKIFEGNDGWPGTQKGHQADPAVYFYELEMRNGLIVRGTIEIVKIK
jgi:gliding motility-associated-like protein